MRTPFSKLPYVAMLFAVLLTSCSSDDTSTDDSTDDTSEGTVNSDYTVGLLKKTDEASDGYTLFAPIQSTTTYLINNCGEEVYEWPSDYTPGHSVYLLDNGYILRPGDAGNTIFNTGGQGGIIEMINSDGEVVWDYTISSSTECQHHDLEYMDNGNILLIVWDKKTSAEAAAAGRTDYISQLWSEKIIEIKPDLVSGTTEVVWEWDAWDHVVQDENEDASNYGDVANSPGLIDINYDYNTQDEQDWFHFNGIDYNEALDQILVSSRSYSEFYIIDHSTTTAEAASHEGGTSGKGGDIIYRWGNPEAYDMGDSSDQKLFSQHNAHWIESEYVDGGMVVVFNNLAGSYYGSDYSTVNVIDTEVSGDGSYSLVDGLYGPTDFQWTYKADTPTDMYSSFISGATRLPNGNTLICVGSTGTFIEVDYNGDTVWQYVNPVGLTGIADQYESTNLNFVFRAERYDTDFEGLSDYDLTPEGTIESGSDYDCE
ncbi:aryl-sulfate sulfotransferase [Formosa sp. L2A11]|uniref:aryl-sulfate sulfotransferase n=1 Tax=Formosa sp. L2A11 TaxID=2686363 RepID=UPI00131E8A5C|nr:aryl-sulfate sulfotransferase [Formosa sp. L2A11]